MYLYILHMLLCGVRVYVRMRWSWMEVELSEAKACVRVCDCSRDIERIKYRLDGTAVRLVIMTVGTLVEEARTSVAEAI